MHCCAQAAQPVAENPCYVQVGSALAVDLTAAEEECCDAAVQVAVTSKGQICGITQRGAQGVSPEYLQASAVLC